MTKLEQVLKDVSEHWNTGSWECYVPDCAKSNGYRMVWKEGKTVHVHRAAHEHIIGLIPGEAVIDHLCRNPGCCNPVHLEVVSQQTNTLRGIGPTAKLAAQTHCKRGHEFIPENTYLYRGTRTCRTCDKASTKNEHSRKLSAERQARYRDRKRKPYNC